MIHPGLLPDATWEQLCDYCDKRDALFRLRVICPACDDVQVQLIEYKARPGAMQFYRCRMCRCRFVPEPEAI